VLVASTHPDGEVARERDRLVERISVARAQPRTIAREALQRKRFGDHPITREMPTGEDVAAVSAEQVRALHAAALVPGGSILVLVGDIDPATAIAQVEKAVTPWTADVPARELSPPPAITPSDLQLVHRAGSVQSQLRLSAPALPRDDPRYAALQLANLVFGGYFSSRWMENVREDKGYTYGAHSGIEFVPGGAVLGVETDVASDVTAAALLETRYELGRIVAVPPTAAEVDAARAYAVGSLLISLDNQGGLASTLSALAADGLGIDWLRAHPGRLESVTVEQVAEAALEFFAPTAFTGVVVGDADVIGASVRALGGVTGP
jgi:zinc protease